ncbi:MAG: hypothetical protein JW932_16360 [Deltaproteobacteria bacterium]|nr:hypothetical protein [Deltaproteobacteria bacterium]
MAARTNIFKQGDPLEVERETHRKDDHSSQRLKIHMKPGFEMHVEKTSPCLPHGIMRFRNAVWKPRRPFSDRNISLDWRYRESWPVDTPAEAV